ncbi:hypothetical protein L0O88_03315 [Bacteroides nordii]|uniref:hypothetical protein n=1 Tax=Bacteroides nordii TaxID=291645 RepID=UPI001EDF8F19|nr:hypothetical protein [Bacteroides nordii]MCG4768113.1 hypothetical protein [Bacteroides nordii]
MKKLKIMALCILTATCSSCLDMLDKTPISQLSVGKLFETADGAEAAVSGCYSFLNGTGYYSQDRWCLPLKAPIYPVVQVAQPIINGLPVKTGGVTGGSPLIRQSALATQP